jgi:hypothetical protein
MTDTPYATVFNQEGLVFYTDDAGRDRLPVLGFLALAMVTVDRQRAHVVWRAGGVDGVIAEALARFYVDRPGFKEAVDGLYIKEVQDRLRSAIKQS